MAYIITRLCRDCVDTGCVAVCPVDCIYEYTGSDKETFPNQLYIHPDECVDCGACEPVCPVEAIYYEDDLPAEQQPHLGDNAAFFFDSLPGRDGPLGSPGGAAKVGPLPVDAPLVAGMPLPQEH